MHANILLIRNTPALCVVACPPPPLPARTSSQRPATAARPAQGCAAPLSEHPHRSNACSCGSPTPRPDDLVRCSLAAACCTISSDSRCSASMRRLMPAQRLLATVRASCSCGARTVFHVSAVAALACDLWLAVRGLLHIDGHGRAAGRHAPKQAGSLHKQWLQALPGEHRLGAGPGPSSSHTTSPPTCLMPSSRACSSEYSSHCAPSWRANACLAAAIDSILDASAL